MEKRMSRVYEYHLEAQQFDYDQRDKEILMEQAFIEDYWTKLIDQDIPNRLVINGVHYTHEGMKVGVRKDWRGSNGRLFTIKLKDGTIIKTNSLWHQGTIPEQFRNQLPNNAEFIND